MKSAVKCDWCGKEFNKYSSRIKKYNFCSRTCLAAFSNKSKNPYGYMALKDYTKISEHMSALNRKLNPTRMTPETKAKLRELRLACGDGKTYANYMADTSIGLLLKVYWADI